MNAFFFPVTTHRVTFQDVTMCGHFAEVIINDMTEEENNVRWVFLVYLGSIYQSWKKVPFTNYNPWYFCTQSD